MIIQTLDRRWEKRQKEKKIKRKEKKNGIICLPFDVLYPFGYGSGFTKRRTGETKKNSEEINIVDHWYKNAVGSFTYSSKVLNNVFILIVLRF